MEGLTYLSHNVRTMNKYGGYKDYEVSLNDVRLVLSGVN
jgi:hypothetical protein